MARQRFLKLPEGFLSMISGLGEMSTAAVMRLTAAHYLDGFVPGIEDGARLVRVPTEDWQRILIEIGAFLDHDALRRGRVVLSMVDDAVAKRDAESNSRSDAANRRNDEKRFRMMAEGRSEPLTKGRIAKRGSTLVHKSDGCTLVHNHDDGCTLVQTDAQVCIEPTCTLVHNDDESPRESEGETCTTLHTDAHLYKRASTSVHVQEGEAVREFAETAEIRHSGRVDSRIDRGQSRASRGTTTYSSNSSEREEDYYESREPRTSSAFSASDHRGNSGSREDDDRTSMGSSRTNHHRDANPNAGRGHSREGSPTTEFARDTGRFSQTGAGINSDGRGASSAMEENLGSTDRPARRSPAVRADTKQPVNDRAAGRTEPSAGPSADEHPAVAEFVDRLREMGEVTDAAARKAASDWISRYGEGLVRRSFDALPAKKLDRPVSYVDAVIRKTRQREDEALPPTSPVRREIEAGVADGADGAARPTVRPRPVKRYIKPALNARWELLGWSAMGENNTTDDPETRRTAWRTDAGTVKFMPNNDEVIPDFTEDPGIYLID